MSKVTFTSRVKVHYKGTLKDGTEFDSSEGKDPLQFTVGQNQVIAGFEKAVIGMEVNETKKITIPSDEAYGEMQEELIHQVSKAQLPQNLELEIGKELISTHQDGRKIAVRVVDVNSDFVTVDGNHPLAGEDLTFELTVVDLS